MKETIEEVCNKVLNYLHPNCKIEMSALQYKNSIDALKSISKWQQERSYSEEEVLKIAEEVRWQAIGDPLEFTKNFDKWFKQFKKD